MPSIASVAPAGHSSPWSATSARRPPSQADSESSRRPSRSKMTAWIKRGTEESNLELWFWRPSCFRYTSPPRTGPPHCSRSVRRMHEHMFVPPIVPDPSSYSYLLGLYLGDGGVGPSGKKAQLVIRLDTDYPTIIGSCVAAVSVAIAGVRVSVYSPRKQRC